MLELWMIRHGMTEGNKINRYIGVTDEPLSPEGRELLKEMRYPIPEALFVSPLRRCRETAGILFPDMEQRVIGKLAECDFGDFENKNYRELAGNPDYQAWVDSGAALPFPGGESAEGFKARTLEGFDELVEHCIRENIQEAALVAHGGTIMSIMEKLALDRREFYQWHVKNGQGYEVEIDTDLWQSGRKEIRTVKVTTAPCAE